LHSTLVRDLVAWFSETADLTAVDREARLRARLELAGLGSALGDMLVVAERASRTTASEEELGLAFGAVVALSRTQGLREDGS
jgi:hypothetical protein